MTGYRTILVAKMQAETLLSDPRLIVTRGVLKAILKDCETPGLPRHLVERGLASVDQLTETIAKHGGLVR